MAEHDSGREASSKVQIDHLNASRPKPQAKLDYAPGGPAYRYAMSDEAEKKNTEIDRRVKAMGKRLERRKNNARDAFNRDDTGLGR